MKSPEIEKLILASRLSMRTVQAATNLTREEIEAAETGSEHFYVIEATLRPERHLTRKELDQYHA